MTQTELRRLFHGVALAAALGISTAPSVAVAQGTGDAGAAQTTRDDNDDDSNLGWLGLLGLAGLLGLRRRDRVDHADTTRRP